MDKLLFKIRLQLKKYEEQIRYLPLNMKDTEHWPGHFIFSFKALIEVKFVTKSSLIEHFELEVSRQ